MEVGIRFTMRPNVDRTLLGSFTKESELLSPRLQAPESSSWFQAMINQLTIFRILYEDLSGSR